MDEDVESWNVITMLSPHTILNVPVLFLKSQKMLPGVIGLGHPKYYLFTTVQKAVEEEEREKDIIYIL